MLLQYLGGALSALVYEFPHLVVHVAHQLLGQAGRGLGELAAQEHFPFAAQEDGAQVAHAVLGDHAAGKGGGVFDVAGAAGGHVAVHQLLGAHAAHGHGDMGAQAAGGHVVGLLVRQPLGVAARHAPGHGGDLLHLLALGDVVCHQRVARLVIGGHLLVLGGDQVALLFKPHGHAVDGSLDLGEAYLLLVLAGGEQGGLVHYVGQVRARGAGGHYGDSMQVHVLIQGLALGMDFKYLLAALDVGVVDHYLPVEAAGTQKRRVEDVAAVGGSQHDNAGIGGKAVHLHQKLVERLLPFVVSTAQARAPLAADGVDLVYEYHAGGGLLGLVEQVAHTAGAHAHVHFHELGAADGVEGHARFARHRLCQQRLAGAGRAYEQHALGYLRAQLGVLVGSLKEVHDLLKFLLLLLGARHVGVADGVLGGIHQLGPAPYEVVRAPVRPGLHAHDEYHYAHEQQYGDYGGQQLQEYAGALRLLGGECEAVAGGAHAPAQHGFVYGAYVLVELLRGGQCGGKVVILVAETLVGDRAVLFQTVQPVLLYEHAFHRAGSGRAFHALGELKVVLDPFQQLGIAQYLGLGHLGRRPRHGDYQQYARDDYRVDRQGPEYAPSSVIQYRISSLSKH